MAVATPAKESYEPSATGQAATCEVVLVSFGREAARFLRVLEGDASAKDSFGRALAYGGDWNGDGVADLAIGAPGASAGSPRAGAVHVHSGADWSRIASFAGDLENEGGWLTRTSVELAAG